MMQPGVAGRRTRRVRAGHIGHGCRARHREGAPLNPETRNKKQNPTQLRSIWRAFNDPKQQTAKSKQ